mmetsp:Transcript_17108/g.32370  ORF Transcript_17108/g.32370 Transcript_17108/m.32370 type:complete len:247 (+) Transcript_17108:991-1731(+)
MLETLRVSCCKSHPQNQSTSSSFSDFSKASWWHYSSSSSFLMSYRQFEACTDTEKDILDTEDDSHYIDFYQYEAFDVEEEEDSEGLEKCKRTDENYVVYICSEHVDVHHNNRPYDLNALAPVVVHLHDASQKSGLGSSTIILFYHHQQHCNSAEMVLHAALQGWHTSESPKVPELHQQEADMKRHIPKEKNVDLSSSEMYDGNDADVHNRRRGYHQVGRDDNSCPNDKINWYHLNEDEQAACRFLK